LSIILNKPPEITKRLDDIIELLRNSSKPESIAKKIVNGIATGIGILGIISIIDIIKKRIGG